MSCVLRWLYRFLALLALLSCGASGAADLVPLPPLQARVTDLTGTLSANQKADLAQQLASLETRKGAQAAILLLPTTQPESIEAFGIRLAEAWKVGHQGTDDGLIVIVAKNDRRMRIEVGYGLEGTIPDAVAKRIVSEQMAPRFKQGDYYGGLAAAVGALDSHLDSGEAKGRADTKRADRAEDGWADPMVVFFVGLFVAGILHAIFGVLGSLIMAGVIGGFVYLATASLLIGAGAGLTIFVLSLLHAARSGTSRIGRGGWGSGGGFSSGGWGSSSGGGFSGGGGGFGGGGASGDW